MLPRQGRHKAKLANQIILYEAESGSFCAAVVGELQGDDVWTGKKTLTLVNKDGETKQKDVAMMTKIFGDPFDQENKIYRFKDTPETAIADIEGASDIRFEFTIEHKQKEADGENDSYTYAEVAWLNEEGGNVKLPEPIDRKTALAKYGSKFKAVSASTGKPVAKAPAEKEKPTAPGKKTPPTAAPKKKTGAGGQAVIATMQEAFDAFAESMKGEKDDVIENAWYAKLDEKFGEDTCTNPDKLSIQQWGELKTEIEAG